MSDRIGFAKTFAIGALSLGATYMLLSQNELPLLLVFAAFVIYAVFQTVYEGLTSAWMSLHIKQKDRGTGLWRYDGLSGSRYTCWDARDWFGLGGLWC